VEVAAIGKLPDKVAYRDCGDTGKTDGTVEKLEPTGEKLDGLAEYPNDRDINPNVADGCGMPPTTMGDISDDPGGRVERVPIPTV